MRGQVAAEGLLAVVVDAGDEPFDGLFGGADGAHGVVDAARAETALDDFEAATFAQDDAGDGDAHVAEGDVAMAVGGVVIAVDVQHALDRDAGSIGGDQNHGLLAVGVAVGRVGFAHDQVDLATGVTGARGPPFLQFCQPRTEPDSYGIDRDEGGGRGENIPIHLKHTRLPHDGYSTRYS